MLMDVEAGRAGVLLLPMVEEFEGNPKFDGPDSLAPGCLGMPKSLGAPKELVLALMTGLSWPNPLPLGLELLKPLDRS